MIRNATREDLPALVDLSRQMVQESPRYSRLTFAPWKLEHLLGALIDSPDGFVMVADLEGELVGVMAAMVSDHWMAVERMASDFGLFILPGYRGGTSAMRMVRAYLEWARARGAAEITLGISTDVQSEQTARFYQSLGLRQFGFLFEVPHV